MIKNKIAIVEKIKKIGDKQNLDCNNKLIKILLLPTVIFMFVISTFFGAINLQMELHSVVIVGIIYIVFFLFIKHNAYYSICTFKKNKEILSCKVTQYINDNLIQLMNQNKAIGSIDKFFDKFSQELRNDNYAAVAPSIFPTLGILGTFISIAFSMPDFNVTSPDGLNQEITKLLGGVGTAFYASIYGIFLSLCWIFFEKIGFSSIEKELRAMRRDFDKQLWSEDELKKASFVEQQSLSIDLQNTIKQSLSPEFISLFNDTISKQTKVLLETIEADKQLHQELREKYQTIIESFSKITDKQDAVSSKLDISITKANQSYEQLSQNVTKLESLSDKFKSNYDAMIEFYEAIVTQNETSQQIAKTLNVSMTNTNEQAQLITSSLNSVTENLIITQKSISEISGKLIEMSSGLQNMLNGINETYNNTIDKQLQTIYKSINTLESLYTQFKNNAEETLLSFKDSAININNSGNQMIASLKSLNIQTIGNSIENMSKSIKILEDSMQTTSKNLDNSVHNFDDKFIEKLRYTFKVLDEEIGTILSKVGSATKVLVDTSSNIEDNLVDFNLELLQRIDLLLSVTTKNEQN